MKTYWRTNQADRAELLRIVDRNLGGRVDLVIDDASHLYGPTRASFEALFPLMPEGGIYIIEDWAWDHWPSFDAPDHPWAGERRLTDLVIELVEAAGTASELIANIEVRQGFIGLERGPMKVGANTAFRLDDHIRRRGHVELAPAAPFTPPSLKSHLRRYLSRLFD